MSKRDRYTIVISILLIVLVIFYDIIRLMIMFIYKQESYMKAYSYFETLFFACVVLGVILLCLKKRVRH